MRIGNLQFYSQSLEQMTRKKAELIQTQQQIGTGKRIEKSGDDPAAFQLAMDLTREENQLEQFQRNITFAGVQINLADTALTNQTDKLASVRESVISLMSGLRSESDVQSFKSQFENDLKEMLDTANTRDSFGNYVFSGASQNLPAFNSATLTYQGSFTANPTLADRRPVEAARGEKVDVNVSGLQAFSVDDPTAEYSNVLQVVQGIIDKMDTVPPSQLADTLSKELGLLDSAQDKLIAVRADIGDRQERMERSKSSNEDRLVDVRLSREEAVGVDLAEAISKFTFQQTQFNALQQSYVGLAKKSLFDFVA